MIIKTERLTLVPLTMEHFSSTCAYAMNPDNAKLMVYLPKSSKAEAADFIKNAEAELKKPQPDFYELAVLLDGKHIGGITMYFEGHFDRGELGWIIHRDFQGNGYAAEAALGLMEYFKNKMGIRRFIAHCDSENSASKRVMEKLGMSLVEIHGGRFNRSSKEERLECLYEVIL